MMAPLQHPDAGFGGGSPEGVRILSVEDVRKVARLARLAVSEDQAQQYRAQLSAVLSYMDRLREVDLEGVEPMSHPNDQANRLDDDVPGRGRTLSAEALLTMAPETMGPFVKVPPVIGEGGGA